MANVIPAVIPKTLEEIQYKISLLNGLAKGLVKKIQLDFVDGKYAPPITWPFNLELPLGSGFHIPFKDEFILEADLFIKHPEDFLDDFAAIGIKSFVIHLDSTHYIEKCIHNIREKGLSVGIGIKPSGDMDLLEGFVQEVDFVQFMGNDKVGYNGVELDRKVLIQIAHFHAKHFSVPIHIDIGVTEQTIPDLLRAGVTDLVSASEVFHHKDVAAEIKKLLNLK